MQENKPAHSQTRGKAVILVVDDSPTIRKLVAMTLESRGYTVVVACDGVDGLAKMQEGLPDLILSDITMPRLDGYQFCKVVKSNKATKNIPVIMLSGNDGLFDKVRGRMAGSANYITKPFEPNNLVKEIEKFVKAARPEKPVPAPARQPATAQGPPPAQARGGSPIDKPADPASARQLSQKLSGIYIPPGAASAGSAARPASQASAAVFSAAPRGDQVSSSRTEPQAPAPKRPSPKHNDEPEIKIFYHSDAPAPQAAAAAPESGQRPAHDPRHSEPQTQGLEPPRRQQPVASGQFATARPQQPASAQPPESRPAAAPPRPAAQPVAAPLLKATCSGCGTVYSNIKTEHVGKYARCKKCGTRFLITV